jgi:putative DNA primase/helicase
MPFGSAVSAARPTLAYNLTDVGNAKRFAAWHGADLRYVSEWGWMRYDGTRWTPDTTGETVRRAVLTARKMLDEAQALHGSEREQLAKWALKSEHGARIDAMVRLARAELAIVAEPGQFDRDPLLLTVQNGTIDLRTSELRAHRREDLITKLAPVRYDPAAPCPRWLAFLEQVMCGDQDAIGFVRRAVGYTLTADTREQCLFLLHGHGANGKGALTRTLEAMLGDYATTADFTSFQVRHSDGPREDLAALTGARMVAASEGSEGRQLAERLVKALTGQDTVKVRHLYGQPFTFRPQFKLWLSTNAKPTIRGTDDGIWRRIHLIPFNRTISKSEQDHALEPALQGDELPGILRWAVDGCAEWLERGLAVPKEIEAATGAYRDEMDTFGQFLDDQCELDPTASEAASALRERHNAGVSRFEQLTANRLAQVLKARGFKSVRGNRGVRWVGLRLRPASVGGVDLEGGSVNSPYKRALEKSGEQGTPPYTPTLVGFESEHVA